MPWNEPGKDKDPWGQRNNDGPPDLDELFKNLRDKFGGLLGGGGKGRIPKVPSGSGNLGGDYRILRGCATGGMGVDRDLHRR